MTGNIEMSIRTLQQTGHAARNGFQVDVQIYCTTDITAGIHQSGQHTKIEVLHPGPYFCIGSRVTGFQ